MSETSNQAIIYTVSFGIGIFFLLWSLLKLWLGVRFAEGEKSMTGHSRFVVLRTRQWQSLFSLLIVVASFTMFSVVLFDEPSNVGLGAGRRVVMFRLSNMFMFLIPVFPIIVYLIECWKSTASIFTKICIALYWIFLGLAAIFELTFIALNGIDSVMCEQCNGSVMRAAAFTFEGMVVIGLLVIQAVSYARWDHSAGLSSSNRGMRCLTSTELWWVQLLVFFMYGMLAWAFDSDVEYPNFVDADKVDAKNQRGVTLMRWAYMPLCISLFIYREILNRLPLAKRAAVASSDAKGSLLPGSAFYDVTKTNFVVNPNIRPQEAAARSSLNLNGPDYQAVPLDESNGQANGLSAADKTNLKRLQDQQEQFEDSFDANDSGIMASDWALYPGLGF